MEFKPLARQAEIIAHERHPRFVTLAKVENKDTQSIIKALIKQARKLPKELYKSLTWDRGS